MIKYILKKLLSSLLHSKRGPYQQKPFMKKYSSSSHKHSGYGYKQGHSHYKNRYGRHSSS